MDAWCAQYLEVRTPGTANKSAVRLKHLCHKLAQWGFLPDSPARFIVKVREPQGRVKSLTPEQRARLLAHANPRLRVYIFFCATGPIARRPSREAAGYISHCPVWYLSQMRYFEGSIDPGKGAMASPFWRREWSHWSGGLTA
jgi:hypothetical protein